jgi:hypothetical protein
MEAHLQGTGGNHQLFRSVATLRLPAQIGSGTSRPAATSESRLHLTLVRREDGTLSSGSAATSENRSHLTLVRRRSGALRRNQKSPRRAGLTRNGSRCAYSIREFCPLCFRTSMSSSSCQVTECKAMKQRQL